MASIKSWIKAMRLRTLPLSLATILTGNFIAMMGSGYSFLVGGLTVLTTVFLQVLSNLANDLGDHLKGTDNANRVGPMRATQSGEISISEMKLAIFISGFLALASGICLLILAPQLTSESFWILFGIGIASILAAIFYTIGKRPYGYRAMGDIFVFIFFGIVGVCGSFYLHSGLFFTELLLPATAIGCFSTAVLNLNNMRDQVNDKAQNKITLVVLLGAKWSKFYHLFLLILGWICISIFMFDVQVNSNFHFVFYLALPLFLLHALKVIKANDPKDFDPELKKLALSTFLFSLLLGISLNGG